ncbi:MAG: arginyltransferase [Methylococcales bacterium]|nr:arginyltransferase [Methylococcales bacterium]
MPVLPELVAGEHPCPYLPGLRADTRFIDPKCRLSEGFYRQLLMQGYRRSGKWLYRPACPNCQLCIPVRVVVADFSLKRRHRRCIQANAGLEVSLRAPDFDAEHFQLYQRYQQARHAEEGSINVNAADYMGFLTGDWSDTLFAEFRDAGQLVAVAVIDQVANALSSVYTFYAPEYHTASLGRYAVLWTLHRARRLRLDWVYLGYWIEPCRKMRYKIDYQPLQYFYRQAWHDQAPET